ncbi:hypothetical protein H0H92_002375 [Tricholoma furcatifolium]|nr:hypothetical protein H0H92_002375 [Tricholoma furcatifolium]
MAASGRRGGQEVPQGLKTHPTNKNVHPAAAAGVAPKPCGSRTEKKENRKLREKQKAAIEDKEAQARIQAAEIEDRLQEEDDYRDSAANHPALCNVSHFRPTLVEKSDTQCHNGSKAALVPERDDSCSSGDKYAQPDSSEDEKESDDLQDNVEEENNQQAVQQHGKKSKFYREHYHREGNSTFNAKWVDQNKAASAKSVAIAREKNHHATADDSLVRMGGITSDEDEEAKQSNIKITPGQQVITKTELRGGSKK